MQKIFFRTNKMEVSCYRYFENAKADCPNEVIEAFKIENPELGFFTIIDDEDCRTSKYFVDIPNTNGGDEWNSVFESTSRPEAIAYAREHFGADENGMICIISHS